MKLLSSLSLTLLMINVFCLCQMNDLIGQIKNDLIEWNLKGKVKKIDEKSYFLVIGTSGNLLKGSLSSTVNYSFDIQGNLSEEQSYTSEGELLTTKYLYKKDDKGRVTECTITKSNGISFKKSFKYNDRGNWNEVYEYDSDGTLSDIIKYTYDETGRLTEKGFYNSGVLGNRYKYDKTSGNEVERRSFNPDGTWSLSFYYNYKDYDRMKNWINQTQYSQEFQGDRNPWMVVERVIEYYQ
jgi:hypothetical protein